MKSRLNIRKKVIAIAVGASNNVVQAGYDVAKIALLVDYVLLMAYDYHRPNTTSYVAPLKRHEGDINDGSIVSLQCVLRSDKT
jgi:GH18 family chitinase